MEKMTMGSVEQLKPSPEAMARLLEQMEEMANAPKEEYGKRSPGEQCMYEIQRSIKDLRYE